MAPEFLAREGACRGILGGPQDGLRVGQCRNRRTRPCRLAGLALTLAPNHLGALGAP